jgi:hypothetical protein
MSISKMNIKRFIAKIQIAFRNHSEAKLEKKERHIVLTRNKALKEAVRMESLANKIAQEHDAELKLTEALNKLRAEKARMSNGNPQLGNMGASLAKGLKKFGSELKTGNAAISKWAKESREKNMPQYFDK